MFNKWFKGLALGALVAMGSFSLSAPPSAEAVTATGLTISGQLNGGTGVSASCTQSIEIGAYDATNGIFKSATTDSTGAFTISSLVGSDTKNTYSISVFTPSGGTCPQVSSFDITLDNNGTIALSGSSTQASIANNTLTISLSKGVTVSGTVKTSAGTGIANIEVFAYSSTKVGNAATTDSTGAFSLQIEAGTYDISFKPKEGSSYTSIDFKSVAIDSAGNVTGGTVSPSTASVTVTANAINAVMTSGNTISGTVTAATGGAAIANVDIFAFDPSTGKGGYASTASNGTYTISVPAGSYFVSAEPAENSGYAAATPVRVDASAGNVTGTNFALTAGVTLSGKITDAKTGEGIGNVGVNINNFAKGKFGFAFTSNNPATLGEYSVSVEAGDYKMFLMPPSNSAYIAAGNISVTVSGATTKNASLNSATVLKGSVKEFASGGTSTNPSSYSGKLPQVSVVAFNTSNFSEMPSFSMTDDKGEFSLPINAGNYRIEFMPAPGDTHISAGVDVAWTVSNNVGTAVLSNGSSGAGFDYSTITTGELTAGLPAGISISGVTCYNANTGATGCTAGSGVTLLPNIAISAVPSLSSATGGIGGGTGGGGFGGGTGGGGIGPVATTTTGTGSGADFFGGFALSDDKGNFTISLKAGTYDLLLFQEPGSAYIPPASITCTVSSTSTSCTQGGATVTTPLALLFTQGATISGFVYDTDGKTGLANVSVNVMPPFDPSNPTFFMDGGFAMTDSTGAYSISIKPPANGSSTNYEMMVFPQPESGKLPPAPLKLTASASTTGTVTYSVPTSFTDPWSNQTMTYSQPTEYNVNSNGTIKVKMQSGNTISGTTYVDANANGTFDSGTDTVQTAVNVMSFPFFDPNNPPSSTDQMSFMPAFSQSNSSGAYSMTVKPGKYVLNIDNFPQYDPTTDSMVTSTNIIDSTQTGFDTNAGGILSDASAGSITQNIQMVQTTSFTGSVKTGGTGVAFIPVSVWKNSGGTAQAGWLGPPLTSTQTDANGNFTVGLPAGTFEVGIQIDPWIVQQNPSLAGLVPPAHRVITVSGGAITSTAPNDNLNFTLSQGATITGTVTQSGGTGGIGGGSGMGFRQIVVYSAGTTSEAGRGSTNPDGSFSVVVPANANYDIKMEDFGMNGPVMKTISANVAVGAAGSTKALGTIALTYLTISGVLKDNSGNTINWRPVDITDASGNAVDSAFTDGSGNFSFLQVPGGVSGSYAIKVGSNYASASCGGAAGCTAANLTIGGNAVTGFTSDGTTSISTLAATITYSTLTGIVHKGSVGGGFPQPGTQVRILSSDGTTEVASGQTIMNMSTGQATGELGSFGMSGPVAGIGVPNGTYKIEVGGSIATAATGGASTFTVSGNTNVGNLIIPAPVTLSGSTTDTNLQPSGGNMVMINIYDANDFVVASFPIGDGTFPPNVAANSFNSEVAPNAGSVTMRYMPNTTFTPGAPPTEYTVCINNAQTLTIGTANITGISLTRGALYDPFNTAGVTNGGCTNP